jgi:hypothetical protein
MEKLHPTWLIELLKNKLIFFSYFLTNQVRLVSDMRNICQGFGIVYWHISKIIFLKNNLI